MTEMTANEMARRVVIAIRILTHIRARTGIPYPGLSLNLYLAMDVLLVPESFLSLIRGTTFEPTASDIARVKEVWNTSWTGSQLFRRKHLTGLCDD